ncbi:MAG TPA: Rrf2 family transcriptional regulator [Blastocatellia bacterium]|jgi:Rrf2 family protein|nr:Rrf2 family transcriptional regulator [Blastocatellia bacterium]
MKIGSKSDYGLRALIDLAERFDSGRVTQAKDIAERQAVPKDYLALIMIDLRKAGFIDSTRGAGGGYRLARPASEITMGEVIRALEGEVALMDCTTDLGFTQCSISLRCRMRGVWLEANNAVSAILDKTTIADLCGPPPTAGGEHETGSQEPRDKMPDGLKFTI